jgi:hypothetical protein
MPPTRIKPNIHVTFPVCVKEFHSDLCKTCGGEIGEVSKFPRCIHKSYIRLILLVFGILACTKVATPAHSECFRRKLQAADRSRKGY